MKPVIAQEAGPRDARGPASLVPAARKRDAAARPPRYDYWMVVGSHALVDMFPMFITSLMIVLQDRLALSRGQ